ncbi:hypothetical protein PsYK624_148720 [Phanerochaete sordida]|uniref:Uncharacterized protein n=1 Tax=Phanerochaete sordida TaxID=48140 RepID=A0A9P3LLT4_9APHY|nr:hypothetical protein PsYK624_148720 [Phanerochaete sordida]
MPSATLNHSPRPAAPARTFVLAALPLIRPRRPASQPCIAHAALLAVVLGGPAIGCRSSVSIALGRPEHRQHRTTRTRMHALRPLIAFVLRSTRTSTPTEPCSFPRPLCIFSQPDFSTFGRRRPTWGREGFLRCWRRRECDAALDTTLVRRSGAFLASSTAGGPC